VNVPANSDVLVAAPLTRGWVGPFTVQNKAGAQLTVTAGSSPAVDVYETTYYARFMTGTSKGLWSTITDDGNDTFTLQDAGVAGQVSIGDTFRVYRHNTVGSVFRPWLKGISYVAGTAILLFDNAALVQNKSAINTVTYSGPLNKWGGTGDATILPPDTLFIIRNNSGGALTYVQFGTVPDNPVSYLLPAGANKDILIGTGYPMGSTVGRTGFGGVGGRAILLFDNAAPGQNKSAVNTVTYSGPLQKWGGTGYKTPIPGGAGFIFRQNGDAGGIARAMKP
jgi:uncharacterized protein (TIGR02597 family)